MVIIWLMMVNHNLVGVYLPLWKIWKSVGMMKIPIYGKIMKKKLIFQTTNQVINQHSHHWGGTTCNFLWMFKNYEGRTLKRSLVGYSSVNESTSPSASSMSTKAKSSWPFRKMAWNPQKNVGNWWQKWWKMGIRYNPLQNWGKIRNFGILLRNLRIRLV